MKDKILVEEIESSIINGRKRTQVVIKCPDCLDNRTIRKDSFKRLLTTCCKSCTIKRRPTLPTEEKVTNQDIYRTKEGRIKNLYYSQSRRCKDKGWEQPEYTSEELINWVMHQKEYHELHDKWVKSNYSKEFSPSIDRIDDYKTYSLSNIQLMSWKENNAKGNHSQKNGLNNKSSIAVDQLDLDGNFIKRHFSMKEAQRDTGVFSTNISKVCDDSIPIYTAGGYKWRLSHKPHDNEMKR